MLTRYWITFVTSEELLAHSFGLRVGVTAFDDTDALSLLADAIGLDRLPAVQSVTANVRWDDLEQNHVRRTSAIWLREAFGFRT